MKSINLNPIIKKYKGLWIALTDSYEFISADKDIRKARDKALKKGYSHPNFFKAPEDNLPFIG